MRLACAVCGRLLWRAALFGVRDMGGIDRWRQGGGVCAGVACRSFCACAWGRSLPRRNNRRAEAVWLWRAGQSACAPSLLRWRRGGWRVLLIGVCVLAAGRAGMAGHGGPWRAKAGQGGLGGLTGGHGCPLGIAFWLCGPPCRPCAHRSRIWTLSSFRRVWENACLCIFRAHDAANPVPKR